ncbi:MAG: DUF1788 domain-containing protein [Planctomycetota bacterium]
MGRIEQLVENYGRFMALPWAHNLAGAQRVWFAVYDKSDERRLRLRLGEFELATRSAEHGWRLADLSDVFAQWMAAEDYRDSYFASPDDLEMALSGFLDQAALQLKSALQDESVDHSTVVAVHGISCLFGLIKVSGLIQAAESSIRGRLLVFFPGEYENGNYRLLDARDGWNYHAVPITSREGVPGP